MASNRLPRGSDDSASSALESLRSDRANLAGRLHSPRWLAPGYGLVAAAVIAIPAVPAGAWRTSTLLVALVAGVALSSAFSRAMGVKLSRVGARAALLYGAGLGVTLLLLSVSYGLAAAGLPWWIAGCALAGFLVATWLVRSYVAAARHQLGHGR